MMMFLKIAAFCLSLCLCAYANPNKNADKDAQTVAVIQILEDDEKRQAFLNTLKHLNTLENQVDSKNASQSMIHNLNAGLITRIEESAQQLIQAIQSLAQFPFEVWQGFQNLNDSDSDALNHFVNFSLLLFLSLATGFGAEFLLRFVLFGLRAPKEPPRTWGEFTRAFLISTLPLILFGLTAYTVAIVFQRPVILHSVHVIIGILFLSRLLLQYFRLFLQPYHSDLRLLLLSDRNARRFFHLISFFVQILFLGVFCAQIFQLIHMNPKACETWKSLVGFGLFLVLATLIVDYRHPVSKWLHFENRTDLAGVLLNIAQAVARLWHILAILLLFIGYLAWIYGALFETLFYGQAIIFTVIFLALWRFLSTQLSLIGQKLSKSWQDFPIKPSPSFDIHHPWRYAKTLPVVQSAYFLIPLAHFCLFFAIAAIILEIWGLSFLTLLNTPQTRELILTALSILLVIISVRILWALFDFIATSQLQAKEEGAQKQGPNPFTQTIVPIARSSMKGLVAFVGFLLILSELNFDIMPIIYAFSVISLAISFGAQTMVKDVITGFLTLFEGNIKVGEYVAIGNYSGLVEAISLRSVFLRHDNGSVQSIPFSEVTSIINRSRHYTQQSIDLAVSHTTSLAAIDQVLQEAFQAIKEHPKFGKIIVEPLKISGISKFTDTAIHISASIRTKPDPRGEFLKEFYALLQEALLKHSILPPLQHQLTYQLDKLARF